MHSIATAVVVMATAVELAPCGPLLSLVHPSYPIGYLPLGSNVLPKKRRREEFTYVHDHQRLETTHTLSQGSASC